MTPTRPWVSCACGSLLLLASACRTTPSSVAEGRQLYGEHGCANCHGARGHGDGPTALALTTQPRDFRNAAAFKNGTDVVAVAGTLSKGLGEGAGRMPSYGHLSAGDRESLALFVISLRSEETANKE